MADLQKGFLPNVKTIKTYVCNRMGQLTLDGLMRLAIEGPSVGEFPFDKAVRMWANRNKSEIKIRLNENL